MQHLICPLCQAPLVAEAQRLMCVNGHHFDRAKQGYYHLHLAQRRKSRAPGDDKAMVMARRAFLQSGAYQPLLDALIQVLQRQVDWRRGDAWVDVGCGEGYYTAALQNAVRQCAPAVEAYGVDISKAAIQQACRQRAEQLFWLVASGAELPLRAHSQRAATCLFTRVMPEALWRVLCERGFALLAVSGPEHLLSLRQRLYPTLRPLGLPNLAAMEAFFSAPEVHNVRFSQTLDGAEQIAQLIDMTPHRWRSTEQARRAVIDSAQLQLDVDVQLLLYRARPKPLA